MNINIVGGGLTGCIMALHAAKLGANVTILEASNSLGGILKDINVDGKPFFNACHYLNTNSLWLKELRQETDFELYDFSHEYSSITELFGNTIVLDDYAQPVLPGSPDINPPQAIPETALDRLKCYGRHAAPIIEWASNFGHLDHLKSECLNYMQLGRLFYQSSPTELIQKKSESTIYNELIGVPRRILNPSSKPQLATLPKKGFNHFIGRLSDVLKESKINIALNAPISPKLNDQGRVECWSRGQLYAAEQIIWTANPIPLLIKSNIGKLENPHVDMYCAVADITIKGILDGPIYYQVFNNRSSIVRLYIYQINNQFKISAEGFWNNELSENMLQTAINRYLYKLNIGVISGALHIEKQRRHVNITLSDSKSIEQFNAKSKRLGVIPGSWHMYGRDQKINFTQQALLERLQ